MLNAFYDGLVFFRAEAFLVLGTVFLFGSLYTPILLVLAKKAPKGFFRAFLLLVSFTFISLILRLAFISKLSLPLYFDSAEHWRIIAKILENGINPRNLTPTYYHVGYHMLATLLVTITQTDIAQIMLISGQVILTLLPVPIYLFIWHETKSTPAAIFSALLGSFAWSMPAFALNWGKYPMLSGIFLALTGLLYSYIFPLKKRQNFIVASIGVLTAAFFHTRMLIFFLIVISSWILAKKTSVVEKKYQRIALGFGLAAVFLFGVLIEKNDLLKLALEPYLSAPGVYATLFLVPLSPLAYKKSPKHFLFSLYMVVGLLAALFVPLDGNLLGLGKLTLLDRPFVETLLYFPLAIIGGLSLAQFTQTLPTTQAMNWLISVLLGIFAFYSLQHYNFSPSPCCNFSNPDDIAAMTWITNNTPPDTKILIAARILTVTPGANQQALSGTDAGIWLTNLTGRTTLQFPYYIDFNKKVTQMELCQKGVNYIYAGNQSFSFNRSLHLSQKNWYQEVLSLPNVRIFALSDCP